MIILDTDIATLLSYGKTEKLNKRIAALDKGEKLALTMITRMEMLDGRFASVKRQRIRLNWERQWSVFCKQRDFCHPSAG